MRGLLTFLFASLAAASPNILFLFSDDQQHDSIRALGNEHIDTPQLDSLVTQGTSFVNAYIMGGSSPAVCSPSRASLFSGRSLWNLENQGIWGFEISDAITTLPQVFREAGYDTFATGKNEPGRQGHFARSFSHGDKILFKGMCNQYQLPLHEFSPDGNYSKRPTMHKGKHSAEVYADACIEFLNSRREDATPFFAYVSFQTPHDPKQCPDSYKTRYRQANLPLPAAFKPEHPFDNGMLRIRDEKLAPFPRTPAEIRQQLADYYAMVTHTDAQIGRILAALDASGKRDNTLIVFASDNGLAVGRHGLMGKQNVYEHSLRVPLVLAGPGIPRNARREQLCYLYDIYPTLCDLAQLKTPDGVEFQSLLPVLSDAKATHREQLYFAFMQWQRGIRGERYKLIEYCVDNTRTTQLFDLHDDPSELRNLAGNPEYKPVIDRLRAQLRSERRRLNDGNTPYPFTDAQGKTFWSTYESVHTGSAVPH